MLTPGPWLTWLRARPAGCALAVGIFFACLPILTTRVLPFHDAPGIIGLGGALALRADPAANIAAFYDFDIRAYPSTLYFGWAWLAGALGVPVEIAFSVFIALFCVAGPPLALWWLLRAFGRPPALALLALPVSYHHQIWYGFLGSAAAILGLLCALAFARRLGDRGRLGDHLGLAGALLFVATAHPFPLALTLAVIAAALVIPPWAGWGGAHVPGARRWPMIYGARLLCLAPTALFLAPWAAGFFGRRSGGPSPWRHVRVILGDGGPHLGDPLLYLRWLGNGYQGWGDDLVPALAILSLVILAAFGLRAASPSPAAQIDRPTARPAPGRWRDWLMLGWAQLVLLVGFFALPMMVTWPEVWWGVRVRCVVPSFLLAIALVRPRPRGLPALALAPAFVAALGFFAFITVDFVRHFRGRVLDGFDQALAAIPPGQSVMAMPVRPDPHYTLPHPYLVQHYVARKGGRAVPHLRGHPGSYWVTMKPPPDSPPWGDPLQFDWPAHGSWDYFLLERPLEGPPPQPMQAAPPGAVRPVLSAGAWQLWQRAR